MLFYLCSITLELFLTVLSLIPQPLFAQITNTEKPRFYIPKFYIFHDFIHFVGSQANAHKSHVFPYCTLSWILFQL